MTERRPMTIKIVAHHASDNRDPQLVGNIVGFDGDLNEINQLTPEEYDERMGDRHGLPWYVIANHADLDRVVAAVDARRLKNREMKELYERAEKADEDRINRLINYYEDMIPAPPEGGTRKQTKGIYSGLLYINQPVRAEQYHPLPGDEAKELRVAAGLMRPVTTLKPETTTFIRDWREKHGNQNPPGFECIIPDTISINLKNRKEQEDES